jgi:AbrB family looped-hinge helix DNA binding protein
VNALDAASSVAIILRLLHRYERGMKMAAAASTTLSSKFQISIPKSVRQEQQWEAGQEFVFIPKGKGVLVMPVPELKEIAGIAKGARTTGYRDRKDRV